MPIKLTTRPVLATFENVEKGDILELRKARFMIGEKTPNEIYVSAFDMFIKVGSRMFPTTFNKYKYKHTGMRQTSIS